MNNRIVQKSADVFGSKESSLMKRQFVTLEKSGQEPRSSWIAGVGALLSILACYGTIAAVATLSLLGITISVNVHVWAAAIVGFAVIAFLGVVLGTRTHGRIGPAIIAALGTLLVIVATYGSNWLEEEIRLSARMVEALGFGALVSGAIWDWQVKKLKRRLKRPVSSNSSQENTATNNQFGISSGE